MKSKLKCFLAGLGCLLFGIALTSGAMLGGKTTAVSAVEEEHVHCVCGGGVSAGEHTECSDATFLPYSGTENVTYNAGVAYLYLEKDVVHSAGANNCVGSDGIFAIDSGETLYLCLNGHSLQNENRTNNVIDVNQGGKLILCDCKGTGWIGGRTSGSNSGAVWVKGTFTMYGGNLKNSVGVKNGGGLFLTGSGSATMYGGTISDNFAFADGGGVFVDSSSSSVFASFTMYGGTVSGNKSTDDGGGVFVKSYAEFTMHGGVIEKNQAGSNGGGVIVNGTFTMNGGSIKGNTAAGRGGGIGVESYGTLTVNGGSIKENTAHGNGGGISACWGAKFTMNGGVIQNNECALNGGGIFLFGNGGWSNATSTFTVTGGTVEQNKAGGFGGGVYLYEYTNFTVDATENDVIIMNNEGSNLYLTDYSNSGKNYVIQLKALTENSRIGVTALRNPWIIFTNVEADYSASFSADSDDYHVGYDSVNKVLGLTDVFNKFTVSYNLNGGEGTVADSICKTFETSGNVQVTSVVPKRTCHTFLGWAESAAAAAATYTAGATVPMTGDEKNKTLYAVWSISHEVTKADKVEPDCTHAGKEAYWSCSVCGKYFEDEAATAEIADINAWGILPVVPHTFAELIAEIAATCASEGVKAHKDCEICHKHFDADGNELADLTIAVDPAAHRLGETVEEVPATEEAEGVKAHKDCEICHKHFDAAGNEITDLTIAKLTAVGGEQPEKTEKSGCGSTVKYDAWILSAVIIGFCLFRFAIKKKKFAVLAAAIRGMFKKN
ncbi:MAG: InlB B-repeat-containing protein [Candidatus Scatosoma sp.]